MFHCTSISHWHGQPIYHGKSGTACTSSHGLRGDILARRTCTRASTVRPGTAAPASSSRPTSGPACWASHSRGGCLFVRAPAWLYLKAESQGHTRKKAFRLCFQVATVQPLLTDRTRSASTGRSRPCVGFDCGTGLVHLDTFIASAWSQPRLRHFASLFRSAQVRSLCLHLPELVECSAY